MPKNLTDVEEFTDPVVVPVDADPRNAGSVETPFQALANRTRYLLDSGYRLASIQTFTADGTWTRPAGVRAVRVTVVGGGGGGGGAAGGSNQAIGGGGGGGATAIAFITSPGASESVTVGGGGSGGSPGANNGSAGGQSGFGTVTANGGSPGDGTPNTTGSGGVNGGEGSATTSGADISVPGGGGGNATITDGTVTAHTAHGGGTHLAGQRTQWVNVAANNRAGRSPGGGGCGALASGTSRGGGAGADGIVIVEEYA